MMGPGKGQVTRQEGQCRMPLVEGWVSLELRGVEVPRNQGRTRNEQSGPSSVGTFKTIPSSWVEPRGLRPEGFMGMETPGEDGGPRMSTANDLERELEKTMFEKVQEENEALRLELERMKKVMSASSSGWSEVSGVGEKTPPPPPPPMDGSVSANGIRSSLRMEHHLLLVIYHLGRSL